MKPKLWTHWQARDRTGANRASKVVEKAVGNLQAGAWSKLCGQVDCLVMDEGSSNGYSLAASIHAWNVCDKTFQNQVVSRAPKTVPEIHFSSGILQNQLLIALLKGPSYPWTKAWRRRQIYFHFLAHESFHVDEPERMQACGILTKNRHSRFAAGVRPDFPPLWKTAVQALTARYPDDEDIPQSVRAAADLVGEGCADLTALYWMSRHPTLRAGWGKFAARLTEARREIHLDSLNTAEREYDIADGMCAILKNGIPTLQSIYEQAWESCRRAILAAPNVDPAIQLLFADATLSPLELP